MLTSRRPRLLRSLLVVAAVLTASLSGAVPASAGAVPTVAWQGTNPYMFAIGDSLLEQCGPSFGMGWRSLGYIGWPGATSDDLRGRLDGTGSGWPQWTVTESSVQEERQWFRDAGGLVLSLGTNDVKVLSLERWRANIDWFMTQARGRPVQWFTVHNPQWQATVDLFNAELRLATDRWPNLKLMDWERYAQENRGVLLFDKVHLATNAWGCQAARNRMIQHAAPAVPGRTAPIGYWYEAPRGTGPVGLNGWAAGFVPDPGKVVSVNVRVDWRHLTRFPADRPTGDLWAQTASGRAFGHTLGAQYRGHVVCLDLVDATHQFTALGCRVV
ncbi:hypothetical protein ACI797_13740 [Geodermatophilus sp. SYSU D00691]